jgi:hypothetical protein
MKDWKSVEGSQVEKPLEIDRGSSPNVVYLRRNIEQVTRKDETSDTETQVWQYEEKELTAEEYDNMLITQELVANAVDNITSFQKETVIDEYTAQLIEEGVI